jgi:hypothetical protein
VLRRDCYIFFVLSEARQLRENQNKFERAELLVVKDVH